MSNSVGAVPYIDIHTHLFFGVDDGSDSIETSIEMARLAASNGTRIIALTPHFNPEDPYAESFNDPEMKKGLKMLKDAVKKNGIPIDFVTGMEVFCNEGIIDALELKTLVTLNGTKHILVEFAFGEDPMFVRHILGRISEKGLVPVLAHPERYFFVQQNPRMIYDWVMSGCVIQINKGSIIGRFGEDAAKTARLLVGHDLVHCVASDAHGTDVRTPVLSEAYDAICVNFGRECAKRLFYTNPAHILLNKRPVLGMPIPFG